MSKSKSRQRAKSKSAQKNSYQNEIDLIYGSENPNYIPGIKIRGKEMDKLIREKKHICDYLREPHLYNEKFLGLCALCDFERCEFPTIVDESYKNPCPIYLKTEKELIRKEQIRLKSR